MGRPDWQVEVMRRDGGCVVRFVNNALWAIRWPMLQGLPPVFPPGCTTAAGDRLDPYALWAMQIDHVRFPPDFKRTDDREHAWTVCPGHHVFGRQWVTKHVVREAARLYIVRANELWDLMGQLPPISNEIS